MTGYIKLALFIALAVIYFALGWIVGLGILVVGIVVGARRLILARRALAPTITCPWCRAEVPQYGGYSCASCHARTLGWAWRCSHCHAWAAHLECSNPECSMSIANPLLPRP